MKMAETQCPSCIASFQSAKELHEHCVHLHEIYVLRSSEKFKCFYCENSYFTQHEAMYHMLGTHEQDIGLCIYAEIITKCYQYNSCCAMCDKHIKTEEGMTQHIMYCKGKSACQHCNKRIKWKRNLKAHEQSCNKNPNATPQSRKILNKYFICSICQEAFPNRISFIAHEMTHNEDNNNYHNDYCSVILHQQALKGRCGVYKIKSNEAEHNIDNFLLHTRSLLKTAIQKDLDTNKSWKGSIYLHVKMSKIANEKILHNCFVLTTRLCAINDVDLWYEEISQSLNQKLENFTENGSNWTIECVDFAEFKFIQYNSYNASGSFPIDSVLKNKKAVVNIDVEDHCCFQYAVLCALHYTELKSDHARASKYKEYLNNINMENINVPVEIDSIDKFEKQNPDIKINVHYWKDAKLKQSLYNNGSTNNRKNVVNLLFVHNEDFTRTHYLPIIHFNRLLGKCGKKAKYCERCYRKFDARNKAKYDKHMKFCMQNKLQTEKMPSLQQSKRKFMRHAAQLSPAFTMYCDMESYICHNGNQHMPACISALIIQNKALKLNTVPSQFLHLLPPQDMQTFVGENCITDFLKFVDEVARNIYDLDLTTQLFRQKLQLSKGQEETFHGSSACYLCKAPFDEHQSDKNREHDHFSGEYRGASCTRCNMILRLRRRFLPVFFHNLRGYDMHFLCKYGFGKFVGWKYEVIAQTREKFMRVLIKKLVDKTLKSEKDVYFEIHFLDSYNFLSNKLSTLAESLPVLEHTLKMKQKYPKITDSMLHSKGIFPYTYFDSLERFDEKELPPKSAFYNDLEENDITNEDYESAIQAWKMLECKSFKDYTLAYLHLDVYLLTDIFEFFRKQCLKEDGLDPVHFVSMPGLSIESAFKKTKEEIELLTDPFMYEFFEQGIRGGMAFTNKHYLSANNAYIPSYDKDKPCIWLLYIDENNLYGNCLRQALPYKNFEWCDLTIEEIKNWKPSDNVGYVLEVDLKYPNSIHDATKDLPLAPEHTRIHEGILTEYMKKKWCEMYPNRKFNSTKKLVMNQNDKECYVVHIALLQFYMEMGMELVKVHTAISFNQKPWLKSYIDGNTRKRMDAKNSFEKDFYKFKSNSLFGKTMENVRKHKEYKLISEHNQLDILAAKPLIDSFHIISEDLVGIAMLKESCMLNKPIFVGQTVLDLSKLIMYNLYYKKLKPHSLIKSICVGGGDTDSLFLEIETSHDTDLYHDILYPMTDSCFDTSNYAPTHFMFNNDHRAELGYFKDEAAGKIITEMVLLKPKMYSIKIDKQESGIHRAKGIKRTAVKKFTHEMYKEIFLNETEIAVNYKNLVCKNHVVSTNTINKRALSFWEDKRAWQSNNYSLPYGHYKTQCSDEDVSIPNKRRKLM